MCPTCFKLYFRRRKFCGEIWVRGPLQICLQMKFGKLFDPSLGQICSWETDQKLYFRLQTTLKVLRGKGVLVQNFILTSFTICCSPTLLVSKMISLVIQPNCFSLYGSKRDVQYCHFGCILHRKTSIHWTPGYIF